MKTFEQLNKEYIEAIKTFNAENSHDCINLAMLQIRKFKAQIIEEGYEFHINVDSCRWAIEQAIINRSSEKSMMHAAYDYVSKVEFEVESYNDLI